MHLSKGYLPSYLFIPGILLVTTGYLWAATYIFYESEYLPLGLFFPWLFCLVGLVILGRTKESLEDERILQIRNFSFRYLSEFLLVALGATCFIGLYEPPIDVYAVMGLILICLFAHLYYLKVGVWFNGIDEMTGKLTIKFKILFAPYFISVIVLNVVLFI